MTSPTTNQLAAETSPYLLQHRDNPVHWQPWGPEAFATARRENRPVLLSIGYAACHWCHVMAHESFEDEETAAVMNEGFVNIKVDREERPDVDAIYQSAIALLGEHGGWPLTMFVTPAGEPFWGGTYFPPTAKFGRPAFRDLLRKVVEVYHGEPDRVTNQAAALRAAIEDLARPKGAGTVPTDFIDRVAAHLVDAVDPVHGGFGQAPKFPQPNLFELLWRSWKRTRQPSLRDAVTRTLERMSQGGIYDHIGGGFARYATDAEWLVPHFEKMLYDNAQLIDLLALVWQETRSPLHGARIEETVDWIVRDMTLEGGGFAASLDADSEGREGLFYLWSPAEIDRLLGADADAFKAAYDVTDTGNWEGANIPNRRHGPAFLDDALEDRLARCRAVLREARDQRIKPCRDDKVLADWNGLAIAALAHAGLAMGRPRWIAAAADAFAFVRDHLGAGGPGEGARLLHAWCGGTARHPATLDDYAAMARAALALFEATGDGAYLDRAESWVAAADRHYLDGEAGGYFLTADDTGDLITRTKTATDAAVPSGNGLMVTVLARLYHLTGGQAYRERAEGIVTAFGGEISSNIGAYASLLNGYDLLHGATEIVIVGARDAPDTRALLDAVFTVSLPNRTLTVVPPDAPLRDGHPAAGKGQIDGAATLYVCTRAACSPPVSAPGAVAGALQGH